MNVLRQAAELIELEEIKRRLDEMEKDKLQSGKHCQGMGNP